MVIETYRDKTPHASPQRVVGQLLPSAGIRYRPVVEDATEQVHQHRDDQDNQKDGSRPHATWLMGLGTRARVLRFDFEDVVALLGVRRDEGGCRELRHGVLVAAEEDGR